MASLMNLFKGNTTVSVNDVTIIIPAYVNSQEGYNWFINAVQSAVAQKCPVVIYDDGSPKRIDGELYKMFGNVVRFARGEKNMGVAFARNMAVKMVKTKLFLPLDNDDKLVPGAVSKMVEVWDGTPVYPDLTMFGTKDIPHFKLLDFSCDHVTAKLGIASVNVLQSVEQWKSLGGWNEDITLYEDSDYNARLFLTFCGFHLKEPLVLYRQHNNQRTHTMKEKSATAMSSILNKVRRYPMACKTCGGARQSRNLSVTTPSQQQKVAVASVQSRISDLPGAKDGRVLALYTGGKGRASHYYRGISTKFAYKVIFNELYYVDAMDTTMYQSKSFFVIAKPDEQKPVEKVAIPVTKQEAPATVKTVTEPVPTGRTPVANVEKDPMISKTMLAMKGVESEEMPDIANMTVGEIRSLDLTPEMSRKLYKAEQNGRQRIRVLEFLKQ